MQNARHQQKTEQNPTTNNQHHDVIGGRHFLPVNHRHQNFFVIYLTHNERKSGSKK